jgi:hypothetical protein
MRCLPWDDSGNYLLSGTTFTDSACTVPAKLVQYFDNGSCAVPGYALEFGRITLCQNGVEEQERVSVFHVGAKTSAYQLVGATCTPLATAGFSYAVVGTVAPPTDFVVFTKD